MSATCRLLAAARGQIAPACFPPRASLLRTSLLRAAPCSAAAFSTRSAPARWALPAPPAGRFPAPSPAICRDILSNAWISRRGFAYEAKEAPGAGQPAPAPEPAAPPPRPPRPWYFHPAFVVLIVGLLLGPSAVRLAQEYLVQRTLDSPMLAMFPRSVRRPLLNAMALETGGRPHLAGQWYYVALGKAVEEGVDHQGELVTALIMRWANLESRLGNGKKAMELYENLFWSLVKAPAALEEDGKTWKVEPKDARISRLDRAGLIALYAAGGAEMMDETATEQEAIDWALQWNRRAANAFLAKDGSDAAVTPETVDNDLGWVEVLAPAVGDIAALDFGKLLDEAAAGVKAGGPPDAPSAPKSPLLPFLRPTKNRNVLITAFNNISEYLFVLDAAPSDPALHPPRGGAAEQPKFPELSPSALLRSLSYRLHGVLLDLDGVNDPCGLAVQLTGIMETYASTGRMGAASAEEFGEKAREVALKSLDAGVPNAVGCTECLASVSTILGSMFRTLGDLDRAIKYYRQLEDDLSVLTVGKLAHGVRGVDRQGNRIEDLAGVLPPEERAKPAFGELQAFARSLREEVERERDGRGQ